MTQSFHCPNCGAPLDQPGGSAAMRCPFCQSSIIVPPELRGSRLDDVLLSSEETLGLAATMQQVAELARAGNKIEAIQRNREVSGQGLSESKDTVEALLRGESWQGHPGVSEQALDADPEQVAKIVKAATVATAGAGCLVMSIIAAIFLFVFGVALFALASPGGPWEEFGLKNNPLASDRVVLSFGAEGSGQGLFQDPRSIAVGPDGALIIADYSTGRVQRFDGQGAFESLRLVPGEPVIRALDIDGGGIVYIVYDGQVQRYDAATWRELGALETPEGLYMDDIRVTPDGGLVAVASGETLLRFDSSGRLQWVVEDAVSSASGDSELDSHAAADGLGNIYVLGTFNNGVFKFSPEGKFLARWGSAGDEAGQLRAPNAIAVDGQARVFVSDIRGIHIFESDGRFVRTIQDVRVTFGMDFDAQGNLWVITNAPKAFQYQVK